MKNLILFFLINVGWTLTLVYKLNQVNNEAYQWGYLKGRESVYQEFQKLPSDGTCLIPGDCNE